jgi:L-ribulose-5-phosphate 3-epimerase
MKRIASGEGIALATLWASGRLYADGAPHDLDKTRRTKAVENLTRAIEAAAELGIDAILVNAVRVGTGPRFMNRYEDVYRGFQEVLGRCVEACARHKVMLLPENVGNRFLLSPMEFARFVDEIRSPWIGVYFDVGNVLLQGYPEDWIPTLGQRIKRIHFKDFKFDGNYAGKMVELMEGDLDWKATMREIRKIGYRGYVVDEWGAEAGYKDRLRRSSERIDRILAL